MQHSYGGGQGHDPYHGRGYGHAAAYGHPPDYGAGPSAAQGHAGHPPGHGHPPPGYGHPPPGYGHPPPGYGHPPPGYGHPGYGSASAHPYPGPPPPGAPPGPTPGPPPGYGHTGYSQRYDGYDAHGGHATDPPLERPPGFSDHPQAYSDHVQPEYGSNGQHRHHESRSDRSEGYHRELDYEGDGQRGPRSHQEDRERRDRREEGRGDGGGRKGKGKGGGDAGSRDLMRSRSPSASSASQPKKRSRRAAGFDCHTKPREPGKVPVEATPQRGLELAPGRKADVQGLKGSSRYNGCEGIVIEGPNDKGRWEVQVDYQCETKTLSLLESNLQPKPSCGWELIVAPISPGIKDTDVSEVLVKHGRVRHVKMTDPVGVCLVEMALKGDAEAAVALKKFELKGTQVSIDWSTAAKTEIGEVKEKPEPEKPQAEEPARMGVSLEQVVKVKGLKGAPQFNGCEAKVVGFRTDRVEVEIEVEGAKKTLALKPENLEPGAAPGPGLEEAKEAEAEAKEEVKEPRKRKVRWEENSGGFVVEGRGKAKSSLPPLSELEQLPVKELKQVLKESGVEITGCLERSEFLQKARDHSLPS